MNESSVVGDESLEFSKLEESKITAHGDDDTLISDKQRMTTKEKVQKLKEDLKRRKAILKGDITIMEEGLEGADAQPNLDISIQIDTSLQEQAEMINAA